MTADQKTNFGGRYFARIKAALDRADTAVALNLQIVKQPAGCRVVAMLVDARLGPWRFSECLKAVGHQRLLRAPMCT